MSNGGTDSDDAAKSLIVWARDNGLKTLKIGSLEVEFWSPVNHQPAIVDEVQQALSAPLTEDEIYGYDPPEHLQDPSDINTDAKK